MKKVVTLWAVALFCISFKPQEDMVVISNSFEHNQSIPRKYSCEGENISPDLHISNVPAEAKSLALIMHDPDAQMKGGFTHWVVWNISTDGHLPENFLGGKQGMNSMNKAGYHGMCPPTGTHHYHFTVYALDVKLDIVDNTNKEGLEEAMAGHIIARGKLTGLYKKRGK